MKTIISVEGLSGSGKSTFSKMISNALNLEYINLDSLAKTCYLEKDVLEKLKEVFPMSIFYDDGNVDFKKLGNIVFNDNNKMKKLESIIYPYLENKIDKIIENSKNGCILDGIKVHETKFFAMSNFRIYVKRDNDNRVNSLIKRDKVSLKEAKQRDNVIDYNNIDFDIDIINDSDLENLKDKIPVIVTKVVNGNKCLYAGSFDPLTYGHLELIRNASKDYDYVFVGIGDNPNKKRNYNKEQMRDIINEILKDEGITNAMCFCYHGYTGQIANNLKVNELVRGVRNVTDEIHEKEIEEYNYENYGLTTKYYQIRGLKHVSSSEVRKLFNENKSINEYVPTLIEEYMLLKQNKNQ